MKRFSKTMYSIANIFNWIVMGLCVVGIVLSSLLIAGKFGRVPPNSYFGVGSLITLILVLHFCIPTIWLVEIAKKDDSSKGLHALFVFLGLVGVNIFYILGGIFVLLDGVELDFAGFFKNLWKRIKFIAKTIFHNRKAFIGSIILSIFIFIAIFGRLIFPFDGTTSFENIYLSPSPEHFLGTDGQGRDLFRMIIHGTRDVLSIAFYAAIITVGIGTVVGVVSGYIGGWVDRFVGLVINIFMSIPTFPLLLIIAHFMTVKGNLALAFLLSIFSWPGLARAVRSQIISLKERDFIQICEVMGLSRGHIIFKELMPNVFSYVAINFINSMRSAITASIGLMTIGAVTYEITNWGGIIITARANGAMSIPEARLCIIAPIVAIMLFQIGAILFSNGLDELVNPRLRKN